jgi:hypothetical protein
MNPSFEQTLVDVWRQVLVENATVVKLGGKRYSVRITPRKRFRQVDFVFDGHEIRGQNGPRKKAGAESSNQIPLGAIGTRWQKSDAVSKRGTVRGECRGWEGDLLRWAGRVGEVTR